MTHRQVTLALLLAALALNWPAERVSAQRGARGVPPSSRPTSPSRPAVLPPPVEELPAALQAMIETERAFAARAGVIGWKAAFLEYFADAAIGFEGGEPGSAREQIRNNPDPTAGSQLIWEPRYGDISASGDLGYLTGPAQSISPARNNGRAIHSNYITIWKRQRDSQFRVVLDLGVSTPGPVTYPSGFTRAPHSNRFSGDYDERTPPLGAADGVLNSALRANAARAYRPLLTAGARLFRPGLQPIVGQSRILAWLASQPPLVSADSRFAESAQSGDLGYTWGEYTLRNSRRSRGAPATERGFYLRVWTRDRSGQWQIVLDVTSPST